MILLFFVAASLVVLVVRGVSPRTLGTLRFRWGWMVLISCALQLAVMYGLPTSIAWAGARGPLLMLAYGVLLLGLAVNHRLPWLKLLTLGVVLNFAVMALNGGQMPVSPEALSQARMTHLAPGLSAGEPVAGTKDVVLPREQTALWPLSDVLIWPPLPRHAVFSPGDVLIALGAGLLIQSAGRAKRALPGQ